MSKYNDGKPIDTKNIQQEELSLAISDWAEGSKSLEDAITTCISSGIPTYASCKGHNIVDLPYLSLIVTKDNIGQILNIMNEVSKKSNIEIRLDYSENVRREGKPISVCTIYTGMLNRDSIFRIIESAAQKSIKSEEISDDVKIMFDFHKMMRTKAYGLFHSITFKKGLITKEMHLSQMDRSYDLGCILEGSKLKQKKEPYGGMMYLAGRKYKDILSSVMSEVDETFVDNKNDELFMNETKETESAESTKEVQRSNSFVQTVETPRVVPTDDKIISSPNTENSEKEL